MNYYEKLEISKYLGCDVIILLHNNIDSYVGKLRHGLTNEDWKEDGEPEALALSIDDRADLVEIELHDIKLIAKASEATFVAEAV